MSESRRVYRVAQAIREQLATRLLESSDDRFRFVTITGVKVTKDLRIASVYWVQSGARERIPEIEEAFQSAKGYFKRGLAEGLRLRCIPELRFFYDNTLDTVEQINELLKKDSGNGAQEGDGDSPSLASVDGKA
ncbi:30S ribosome-binding factor RbfA [bacterium]|nr:30S ribosome-binding factor RbfA [bacterium]